MDRVKVLIALGTLFIGLHSMILAHNSSIHQGANTHLVLSIGRCNMVFNTFNMSEVTLDEGRWRINESIDIRHAEKFLNRNNQSNYSALQPGSWPKPLIKRFWKQEVEHRSEEIQVKDCLMEISRTKTILNQKLPTTYSQYAAFLGIFFTLLGIFLEFSRD